MICLFPTNRIHDSLIYPLPNCIHSAVRNTIHPREDTLHSFISHLTVDTLPLTFAIYNRGHTPTLLCLSHLLWTHASTYLVFRGRHRTPLDERFRGGGGNCPEMRLRCKQVMQLTLHPTPAYSTVIEKLTFLQVFKETDKGGCVIISKIKQSQQDKYSLIHYYRPYRPTLLNIRQYW